MELSTRIACTPTICLHCMASTVCGFCQPLRLVARFVTLTTREYGSRSGTSSSMFNIITYGVHS